MPVALVVDSDRNARDIVCVALRQIATTIYLAASAAEAASALKKQAIDLLITEMSLPDRSGIDLILEAKRIRPSLAIIAAAHVSPPLIVEAFRLGVRDYIFKPFTSEHIRVAIQRCFEPALAGGLPCTFTADLSRVPCNAPPNSDGRGNVSSVTVALDGGFRAMERQLIQEVILRCNGNKAAAARTLKIHRRKLYRLLEQRDRAEAAVRSC